MHGSSSGLTIGTGGSPQTGLEQLEYSGKVSEIEGNVKAHQDYLRNDLPKSSPLKIPSTAEIKEEHKQGYEQVKYNWERGKYKYQSRWHSRTPNAPKEQGDSWVVERKIPGVGNGPNARRAKKGGAGWKNNKWK